MGIKKRLIYGRGSTILKCSVCEKEFTRPNAHIRSGSHSCSRSCAGKAKIKKRAQFFTACCLKCGKEFSRTKHRAAKMLYCSRSCARISVPRGKNHPNWKGGISERTHSIRLIIRKKVKETGKCQRCGLTENLHGHHKFSYSDHPELRDEPDNIEIICSDCHALEHPKWANMILRPVKRSGIEIKCLVCGEARYVPLSLAKTAKFCSREHKNLHQKLSRPKFL